MIRREGYFAELGYLCSAKLSGGIMFFVVVGKGPKGFGSPSDEHGARAFGIFAGVVVKP